MGITKPNPAPATIEVILCFGFIFQSKEAVKRTWTTAIRVEIKIEAATFFILILHSAQTEFTIELAI